MSSLSSLRSDAPPARPLPSPSAAGRPLRLALCLSPLLVAAVWGLTNRSLLYEGVTRLARAEPAWLLAAAACTCLTWVVAACMRQGAVPDRLPPGLLLASQFAAGAANHVLPAGLGAHAVTVRFLRTRGVPLERATASVALYSVARSGAKAVVLIGFLLSSSAWRRLGELVPDGAVLVPLAAGVTLAGVATAVVRPLRRPLTGLVRCAFSDARTVHARPSRVLALWGGAAAMPLVQASVLACTGQALGLGLSWPEVTLAYLAAGTAGGAVPVPGGVAVDAALVFTLAAFGSPPAVATATVIGYRVLTDWMPLLPGALVLSAMIRAKVL
ncbi:lysylphosphatidylglycerol synthase transmembrane domain-containing protein [Streptomyces fuscichromogenes]|uniref:Membrane protein n=1 Tax=Streptomyces fuscichromogenes TaxID=1324013 RepID=A0A917XJ35_9ACTN|nr:lysylphosphatidylglycerol synthase transmembrane domain-containing protein [Streptomyces fuscichromogenes]GGN31256.1 membrane protein [Streptomyces fuscichromogenes]